MTPHSDEAMAAYPYPGFQGRTLEEARTLRVAFDRGRDSRWPEIDALTPSKSAGDLMDEIVVYAETWRNDGAHFGPQLMLDLVSMNREAMAELATLRAEIAAGRVIKIKPDDTGIIMDALIEHAASSRKRKGVNSESLSDERAERCDYLILLVGHAITATTVAGLTPPVIDGDALA